MAVKAIQLALSQFGVTMVVEMTDQEIEEESGAKEGL
jgi:hypothetical protein